MAMENLYVSVQVATAIVLSARQECARFLLASRSLVPKADNHPINDEAPFCNFLGLSDLSVASVPRPSYRYTMQDPTTFQR
jgi:hypothetical protein